MGYDKNGKYFGVAEKGVKKFEKGVSDREAAEAKDVVKPDPKKVSTVDPDSHPAAVDQTKAEAVKESQKK